MATGTSPLQMLMSAMQNRSAAGGPAGAPGAGPGLGMETPGAGDAYASQVSELKGADPGQLLSQLKKMKQIFAVLLVQNLERLPNVSGQISKLIPQIDKVIKEVQQASSVNAAVRNPIQMGAAQPQPGAEGGTNRSPGMF